MFQVCFQLCTNFEPFNREIVIIWLSFLVKLSHWLQRRIMPEIWLTRFQTLYTNTDLFLTEKKTMPKFVKHELLRSRASRCLSLSSSSSLQEVLEIYRDTRAYIVSLASPNFLDGKKPSLLQTSLD